MTQLNVRFPWREHGEFNVLFECVICQVKLGWRDVLAALREK